MKTSRGNDIYRMDGIGKVFRFTLTQTFKNKGYLISYIMMIAMMTFMGPISMLSAGASEKAVLNSESINDEVIADTIFYDNQTDIDPDISEVLKGTGFSGVEVVETDSIPDLSDTQIGVVIYEKDTDEGYYHIESVISDDSQITALQLDSLTEEISDAFDDKKIEYSGAADSSVSLLYGDIGTGKVKTEEEYLMRDESRMPNSQLVIYSTVYSVIIMILVSLTVSYVISAVMEEKTSKLVENLLVSVRPLALIMGKIGAMMVYVLSMLFLGAIGSSISNSVMGMFFTSKAMEEVSNHVDFAAIAGLSLWKILILLLSLILTYLMFSILAGIFGSACTKTEEIGPVVMLLTMLSMAGYIAGMALPYLDVPILDKIVSIVPFISSYVGPIYFVCGRIPFYIYLIGLALQVVFIIFLFRLCAKVYRKLIINDSKKLNIVEIFKLAGKEA